MKKMLVTISLLLAIGISGVQAQYRNNGSTSINSGSIGAVMPSTLGIPLKFSGLLDMSKLHMQQEFSSGFSTSNSGKSLSALYLNSMTYQVSPNYEWVFALGYGGTAMNSFQNGQTGGSPVGMVGFNWKPQKNLLISASFGHNMWSPLNTYDPMPWSSQYGWEQPVGDR